MKYLKNLVTYFPVILFIILSCSDAPEPVQNALNQIIYQNPPSLMDQYKVIEENIAVEMAMDGIGRDVRKLLITNNQLREFFKSKNVLKRNDIVEIMVRSLHRKLNNRRIKLNEQIEQINNP